MGLSNEKPKDQLTTLQALLDISEGIRTLCEKPDVIADLAKQANTLPAQEEAKAKEARARIAEYTQLLADVESTQKAVELAQSKLDNERDELDQDSVTLKALEAKLINKESALDDRKSTLDARENTLKQAEVVLSVGQKQLETDRAEVARLKQEAEDYLNNLKEAAAKAQEVMKGL